MDVIACVLVSALLVVIAVALHAIPVRAIHASRSVARA